VCVCVCVCNVRSVIGVARVSRTLPEQLHWIFCRRANLMYSYNVII
jgi:hypothetical protein